MKIIFFPDILLYADHVNNQNTIHLDRVDEDRPEIVHYVRNTSLHPQPCRLCGNVDPGHLPRSLRGADHGAPALEVLLAQAEDLQRRGVAQSRWP